MFFFQDTYLVSNPSHTTFYSIKYSMASECAGWSGLSHSTSGVFPSGLSYHVSGTSKSLAGLSGITPGEGVDKTEHGEQGQDSTRGTSDRRRAECPRQTGPGWTEHVHKQTLPMGSSAQQREATPPKCPMEDQ